MEGCSYVGRQQEISKSFILMRPSSSHGVAWHGRPHLVTHEMCLTQEACRRAGGPGYNDQVGRDGKTNAVRQTCRDGKQGALMRRPHEPLLLSAPPQITWRGTLRSDICGLEWAQKGPSASSTRAPLTPLIALEGNNGRTTHFSSHTDQERSTFFFFWGPLLITQNYSPRTMSRCYSHVISLQIQQLHVLVISGLPQDE